MTNFSSYITLCTHGIPQTFTSHFPFQNITLCITISITIYIYIWPNTRWRKYERCVHVCYMYLWLSSSAVEPWWWSARLASRSWAMISGKLELIKLSAKISSLKMFLFMSSIVIPNFCTYSQSSCRAVSTHHEHALLTVHKYIQVTQIRMFTGTYAISPVYIP